MEVALRGLSSAGNDYDCQDGELQVCHNAINNGAGLRPIQEPTAIAELPAGWKGLAFVHHTSAGDTYIIRDGSGNAWYGKADDIQTGESAAGALTQMTEPQAGLFKDGEYQLSSVGNVLVVNFSGAGVANGTKGIHYYRWNDDQDCYKYLGQYPPDLKLEFSMVHYSGHVESDGSITYNDGCLMYYETGQSVMSFSADDSFTQGSMICYPDGNSDYDKLVDELLGKVNKIKGEMRRQGLFLGRVFVRTAYKLYDGNYIMQSAPVLLAPTMEDNPLVWPYSIDPLRLDSAGKGEWSIGVKYRIYFRPFVLCVKSLATAEDKAKLKEWKEVIDEVCVFVTPELQDYVEEPGYMVLKRKEKMLTRLMDETETTVLGEYISDRPDGEKWRYGQYRAYMLEDIMNDGYGLTVSMRPPCPMGIALSGAQSTLQGSYINEGDDASTTGGSPIMASQTLSIDTREVAILKHGQYIEQGGSFSWDDAGEEKLRAMLTEFCYYTHIIQFERKPDTEEKRVEQQYLFYPLKEYSIDEATKLGEIDKTMEWPYFKLNLSNGIWPRKGEQIEAPSDVSFVKFEKNKLENLTAQTDTLPDDYGSWQKRVPKYMHTYNNRLSMANVAITFRSVPEHWLGGQKATGRVMDGRLSGQVVVKDGGVVSSAQLDVTSFYNISLNAGFFYYPHPKASKIEIAATLDGKASYYAFEMKPHPYLYGSYFYDKDFCNIVNLDANPLSKYAVPAGQTYAQGVIHRPNYMYTSEVDNPFTFPSEGVNAIGSGEIVAIKSASKSMSEGTAFGSMPLYAFCTDGVWPLSVGETGLFVATNPPTRETLVNNDANALLQTDNAVIFMSDRGLMRLVGESTVLLSGQLRERFGTFDVAKLPGWDAIMGRFDDGAKYLEADDFLGFIRQGARLAFDYVNYRVIVFRPYDANDESTHTAYVYDVASESWATMASTLTASVEGYPASMVNVIGNGGKMLVARFDQGNTVLAGGGKAFYTTRPMKFGKADTLKTVRTLFERAVSHGGAKYLGLWGSRDMTHWIPIGAVKGGRMPRLSGTPYKYFIAAGWSELDVHGDTISRLTVEEADKYQDKIR